MRFPAARFPMTTSTRSACRRFWRAILRPVRSGQKSGRRPSWRSLATCSSAAPSCHRSSDTRSPSKSRTTTRVFVSRSIPVPTLTWMTRISVGLRCFPIRSGRCGWSRGGSPPAGRGGGAASRPPKVDRMQEHLDRLRSMTKQAREHPDELDVLTDELSDLAVEIAALAYERKSGNEEFAPVQLAYENARFALQTAREKRTKHVALS